MNKLDIISKIWNYFQGCSNSVDWRDAGLDEWWTGGIAGLEGCWTEEMLDWRDAGLEGCWTGGRQDMREAEKE